MSDWKNLTEDDLNAMSVEQLNRVMGQIQADRDKLRGVHQDVNKIRTRKIAAEQFVRKESAKDLAHKLKSKVFSSQMAADIIIEAEAYEKSQAG